MIKRAISFLAQPIIQRKTHVWLAVFWAVQLPAVCLMYWLLPDVWKAVSILYLALVSIYANFVGEVSSAIAAKVEMRQEEIEEDRQEELMKQTEEIVEKVDEKTPDPQ